MFIDPNNMIDNGSSTSIATAESNGYYSCSSTQTSTVLELNGPDKINIYPNPTKENVYVSNLKEDNVDLKVYDINGKIVMQQKISNKEYLNVSKLSNGIYQLTFEGKNWKENRKLIKE